MSYWLLDRQLTWIMAADSFPQCYGKLCAVLKIAVVLVLYSSRRRELGYWCWVQQHLVATKQLDFLTDLNNFLPG